MKQYLYLISLILLNAYTLSGQNQSETKKEIKSIRISKLDSLTEGLKLVEYADLSLIPSYKEHLLKGSEFPYNEFILGIRDYLTERIKLKIIESDKEVEKLKTTIGQDKIVSVYAETGIFNQKAGAIGTYIVKFAFIFNNGKIFEFKTKVTVMGITNYRNLILETLDFNFPVNIKK